MLVCSYIKTSKFYINIPKIVNVFAPFSNTSVIYWEGLLMISGRYGVLSSHGVVPYMSVHLQDAESFHIKAQFNSCTVLLDCNTMISSKAFVNTVSVLTTKKRRMFCFDLTCSML